MSSIGHLLPANLLRHATAPQALGGAAAGALLGLALGAGWIGALGLGVVGWSVAALFMFGVRRSGSAGARSRIDPFAVNEPWRFFVRDALTARNRFDEALGRSRPGPLRDRLVSIRASLDAGVHECWEVALQAQHVADARSRLDAPGLRRKLSALEARTDDTGVTERSLRAQLESAERLDSVLADVTTRLEVLEAQLTEAVTSAIEISALSGQADDLVGIGSAVENVVDELEALRLALAETNGARPGSP